MVGTNGNPYEKNNSDLYFMPFAIYNIRWIIDIKMYIKNIKGEGRFHLGDETCYQHNIDFYNYKLM